MLSEEENDQNSEMITQAMLIINSVAFLETQIHQALGGLQEAVNNHFLDEADRIEAQIRFLLKKTNEENRQMDDFMVRYGKKINEKKTILPCIEQEKQIHNGRVSANKAGARGRAALQREPQKENQRLAVNN